jgi:small subunit ribosomal protein S1
MSTEEPKQPGETDFDFRILRQHRLERGEVVKGTVVSVGSSHVFVDVGGKSEASLELKEVTNDKGEITVKVGDTLEAFVLSTEPEIVLSHSLARNHLNLEALEDAKDLGIPVEGRVTGVNKGGLEVDLKGARAFCPISQIELGYCENASVHIDKVYEFRVIEFAEGGRKLVVSRRALLEEQRQEAAAEVQAQLHEGAEFEGEVTTLQPYGAFVDIGGVQGMVHISQIGLGHIGHPEEVLRVGQKVRVKVMKVEPDPKHPDRQRIALSMRALMGDPWEQVAASLHEGSEVQGKVVRLQPFGAFVEIAPGIDGLVHISELADRRIQHPSEAVEVGQTVNATVLKVDVAAHRISLSLRGAGEGGATAGGPLSVGSVVDVVVDKVKPFGLLVRIKSAGRGGRGLIPIEETGAGRNANLRRSHPEGTELKAMIVTVEPETGKLRLSLRAVADQEERAEFSSFVGDAPAAAPGSSSSSSSRSLGTLGDLLQKSLAKKK